MLMLALCGCRAWRLQILCVRESWKATSVQLAGLDLLLGTPAEQRKAVAAARRSASALLRASVPQPTPQAKQPI